MEKVPRFEGCCRPGEPGTILTGADGRMLRRAAAAAAVRCRLGADARAANELQVPASRQTDWLLRHLPVAQIVPPAGSDAVAPHVTVRLRDSQTQ